MRNTALGRVAWGALLLAVLCAPASPPAHDDAPSLDAVDVRATFDGDGATLTLAGRHGHMGAIAVGRDGAMRALPASSPARVDGEVHLDRGSGVTEWWRGIGPGLEHGLTLLDRPEGAGELVVEIAVEGLLARAATDDAVDLLDATGARVGTYSHLVVTDAHGVARPARMSVDASGSSLRFFVEDADATYPIVIDPALASVEEAVLTGVAPTMGSLLGVAVTDDGTRLVAASTTGRVFVRSGTTWTLEGTLTPAATGAAPAGCAAITQDGTRVILGGGSLSATSGSASVFTRGATGWSLEASLSRPGSAMATFGSAVAIDASGSVALVGDPYVSGGGAAFVYRRSGITWSLDSTLQAAGTSFFGASLAITADASRLVVGAGMPTGGRGSVVVYALSGAAYALEYRMQGPNPDGLGSSIDISDDGSVVAAGAPSAQHVYVTPTFANANVGDVRLYRRSGTTWTDQGTTFDITADTHVLGFGTFVSIAADGSSVLVTRNGGINPYSAVVIPTATWSSSPYAWSTRSAWTDIMPSSACATARSSVALTGNADRAVIAAPYEGNVCVYSFAAASPNGAACGSTWTCASGYCVDGVCCESECGHDPLNPSPFPPSFLDACQGCSAARTGVANGTCAPLLASIASTITCRATRGPCDVAETCSTTSTSCPADGLADRSVSCAPADDASCSGVTACDGTSAACPTPPPALAGTACRPADLTSCAAATTCDGTSTGCPAAPPAPAGTSCLGGDVTTCTAPTLCDGVTTSCPTTPPASPAGTLCRASASGCDAPELCDGTNRACPTDDPAASGAVCRPSIGDCDVAEACDGTSRVCPGDMLLPAGTHCGGTGAGSCAGPGMCSGASAMCTSASALPAGTQCHTRDPSNPCDLDGFCDGALFECPASFAPATTVCSSTLAGPCDAPDHCAGTSATCVPTFVSGVVCRAATGACDIAESCSGTAADCPPDGVIAAGLVCRMSTNPSCDPAENCDGSSTQCPADVVTCPTMSDGGGRDAAVSDAASSMVDASTTPAAIGGCACHAGNRHGSPLAMLVALALLGARRRRGRETFARV